MAAPVQLTCEGCPPMHTYERVFKVQTCRFETDVPIREYYNHAKQPWTLSFATLNKILHNPDH